MIAVGSTSTFTVGAFTAGVVNQAPVVTPPGPLSIQFANGGAGLSKTNATLVAWGQTGSATDFEDGSVAVAADFSGLPATIPAGTHSVPFRATDSNGLTGVAYASLIVSEAVAVNAPPVSSGNYSSQSATVGVPFTFNAAANFSDPGDTLTYSATGLPAGLTINPSTGMVTGTPSTAQGYTATITATDSVGQTATALLPIVVGAASSGSYLKLASALIAPDNKLYARNDFVLAVTITDDLDAAIVAGTVLLTVKDSAGSEVSGLSWPVALSHKGFGAWSAIVDAALSIEYGKQYVLELSATSGTLDGFWKQAYTAQSRGFS